MNRGTLSNIINELIKLEVKTRESISLKPLSDIYNDIRLTEEEGIARAYDYLYFRDNMKYVIMSEEEQ